MIKIKYTSNNSGGTWRLTDKDWYNLQLSGWKVDWFTKESNTLFLRKDKNGDIRFLDALATTAEKDFETFQDAIEEFETVTKQDSTDEGCNCCGAPHSFMWVDSNSKAHWASGEDILKYLYSNNQPKNLREALELLNEKD